MSGLNIIDIHIPLYLGDVQFRQSASSHSFVLLAITTVPSLAPSLAIFLASLFVESTESKCTILLPIYFCI
jgi:hypothetical protein